MTNVNTSRRSLCSRGDWISGVALVLGALLVVVSQRVWSDLTSADPRLDGPSLIGAAWLVILTWLATLASWVGALLRTRELTRTLLSVVTTLLVAAALVVPWVLFPVDPVN